MRYFACAVLLVASLGSGAQGLPGLGMVGDVVTYTIQAGDTLTGIGARHGVEPWVVARENKLDPARVLRIGRTLRIDNRHIVPSVVNDGIVVNLPQRMLFRMRDGVAEHAFPVGLGRPDWPTEQGEFTVVSREEGKTWFVPPSIQKEMAQHGETVRARVPPGPDNPLGRHWLGLSLPGLGIHGTIAPESIYHFQSHGCIRMHPEDAESMFSMTQTGDTGVIVYEPVLLNVTLDGRVYLEVHRDIYREGGDAEVQARELAAAAGVDDSIDWNKAVRVIAAREGVARDVTRVPDEEAP